MRLAEGNPTAQASLRKRGAIFVASSRKQARDWANRLAAEHITVDKEDLPFIQNAGSVFVGDYSAQAAGDYASGPNHVLPTGGQARFRGGLSVLDFVKVITVQKLSGAGTAATCARDRMPGRRRRVAWARQLDSCEVRKCLGLEKPCELCRRIIRLLRGGMG